MDAFRKINAMRIQRGWPIYRLSVESDLPQIYPGQYVQSGDPNRHG